MQPTIKAARDNFPAIISQVEAISDYACQAAFGEEELQELHQLALAFNNAAGRIEHKILRAALQGRRYRRAMEGRP